MLFPYTYVPHQMDRMQEFIDFIFFEVWCKAPAKGPYSLSLYDALPDLSEVMTAFHYDDSQGAEFFSGHVERIYNIFATLAPPLITQISTWYQANNDIERVCTNVAGTTIVRYEDFPAALDYVKEQVAGFFKKLYSHLDIAALKTKIGNIDDHYQSFVQTNRSGKCPFCGINDLFGEYHSKREAYDHYLPKAIYPFNSINFKNLVPACHHCNSSYKTIKDPVYTPKDPVRSVNRRAAFFPYTTAPHAINVRVELLENDINRLEPANISLIFGPAAVSEQIETWKDVYGIEERYKAKLCSNDAMDWIEQFRILNRRKRFPANDHLDDIEQAAPYANCNFLKKAFMHECHRIGLLATIENYRDDATEEDRN
ncbi:HNH endonuclease [Rheinheimera faecalis]